MKDEEDENLIFPGDLLTIQPELYKKVLIQLEKDFNLCGIVTDWSVEMKASEFWPSFLNQLWELMRTDPLALRNLCYRVDLPEKALNALAIETTSEELSVNLAKALLIREIEKVSGRTGTY